MLRSTLLSATLTLGLALCAHGQQLANNGGYVTSAPAAVNPSGAPSVPAISTPVAHVGHTDATPTQPGVTVQPPVEAQNNAPAPPEVIQVQNANTPVTVEVSPNGSAAQPVNLGVATISENPFLVPGTGTDGQSLGEIAREYKQKDQNINAKVYTNANIDQLNQSTGVNTGVTTANAANDNWTPNNGVITPPASNQNSIASPAQSQSTTGAATSDNQNTNPPQAFAKPSAGAPYQMAQNNPSNAGIPQSEAGQNTSGNTATAQDNSSSATLPKTASRLPLLGVLGFFSITMGLFVRHQRAKTAKS